MSQIAQYPNREAALADFNANPRRCKRWVSIDGWQVDLMAPPPVAATPIDPEVSARLDRLLEAMRSGHAFADVEESDAPSDEPTAADLELIDALYRASVTTARADVVRRLVAVGRGATIGDAAAIAVIADRGLKLLEVTPMLFSYAVVVVARCLRCGSLSEALLSPMSFASDETLDDALDCAGVYGCYCPAGPGAACWSPVTGEPCATHRGRR